MSKIKTLYLDKDKTIMLYPRTKTSAVTNTDGVNVDVLLNNKQDKLISGQNIKTINNVPILGNGNIVVSGGEGGASSWDQLQDKPFTQIDTQTLVIDNNVLKVNTTDSAEADNTKPITSSGVHTLVGNIDALLKTI